VSYEKLLEVFYNIDRSTEQDSSATRARYLSAIFPKNEEETLRA
jgi:hypothetical protein